MNEANFLDENGLAKCGAGMTNNPHVKKQTPTLYVETAQGLIEAGVDLDPNFPGVHVKIGELLAAVVEHTEDDGYILRVYSEDSDDAILGIVFATGEVRDYRDAA